MSAAAREGQAQEAPRVLVSRKPLLKMLDASEATLYRWMKDDEIKFPRPLKIGASSRWDMTEVGAWLAARKADRDAEA